MPLFWGQDKDSQQKDSQQEEPFGFTQEKFCDEEFRSGRSKLKSNRKARVQAPPGHHQQQQVTQRRALRRQRHGLFFFALSLVVLIVACSSSSSLPQVILFPQTGEPVRVAVEIADTPTKRNFGLMYRRDLPQSHGMLFLFPHEEPLSFWMKNTPLPLDIIFINAARTIVGIAANTTPFSEIPLPSQGPAQFVLEVNAGFCQRNGIAAGAQVTLPGLQPPPT